MPDGWEIYSGTDPLIDDSKEDLDGDGLDNYTEYSIGTLCNSTDSDKDGMPDGWEVNNNLDPLRNNANEDNDQDGLTNLEEYNHNTDPNNPDTDGDGINDGDEVNNGTDPLDNEDPGVSTSTDITTPTDGNNSSESTVKSSFVNIMIPIISLLIIIKAKKRVNGLSDRNTN